MSVAGICKIPDFIIIGAQRCGTTSLYNSLITHPCVLRAHKKEIQFFSMNFGKGLSWYQDQFPRSRKKGLVGKVLTPLRPKMDFITGEASPYYMYHPLAPRRASEAVPHVKLIALLRNPVDRAYSHYNHEVKRTFETLTFEEAIDKEEERIRGERDRLIEDENYDGSNHRHYSYKSRGIYVDQLENWMRFFPQEQILIVKSEDFYNDHAGSYQQTLRFLDLPRQELSNYRNYNKASYPEMDSGVRRRLIKFFEPHNERLYKYLNVDFNWH